MTAQRRDSRRKKQRLRLQPLHLRPPLVQLMGQPRLRLQQVPVLKVRARPRLTRRLWLRPSSGWQKSVTTPLLATKRKGLRCTADIPKTTKPLPSATKKSLLRFYKRAEVRPLARPPAELPKLVALPLPLLQEHNDV